MIFLSFYTVALILPFELKFPRLVSYPFSLKRFITIIFIAITNSLLIYSFPFFLQQPLINFVGKIQFLSMPMLPIPSWLGFVFCFLLIDFVNYLLHKLSHKVPFLWRLHKIHHTDTTVTGITGLLHHPGEILISYLFMVSFFVLIGMPVLVIICYSAALQVHSILSHANMKIPTIINSWFKYLIILPDIHRIHHSIKMAECNSNFGEIFPFWDILFGTYRFKYSAMSSFKMGLPQKEQVSIFTFLSLLVFPVRDILKKYKTNFKVNHEKN